MPAARAWILLYPRRIYLESDEDTHANSSGSSSGRLGTGTHHVGSPLPAKYGDLISLTFETSAGNQRLTIRVSTEVGETATTIRIEGRLTGADLPDMRTAYKWAKRPLRLDLSGLKSADIDGIRALRSLSETGAELHGVSPYINQLLLEAGKKV